MVRPRRRGWQHETDRIVCLSGQTWFIELKIKNGRLPELQKVFAGDMRRLGQNYAVLWSKEEVDEWLSSI